MLAVATDAAAQDALDARFAEMDQAKRQRDSRQVIAVASDIVAHHPEAGRAWYRLGGAKSQSGDDAGAEAAFQRAADLHFNEPASRLEAARLAARLGRRDDALRLLQQLGRAGFDQREQVDGVADFAPLTGDGRYQAALLAMTRNVHWIVDNARWSTDGTRIIFERRRSTFPPSASQIFDSDREGAHETQLTFGHAVRMMADFSPDSRRIVYAMSRDGGPRKLYIEDLDTHREHMVVLDSIGNEHYPAWSPDGTQIAFNADRGGHRQVYIVDVDGSGIRRLTDAQGHSDFARWSADGAHIVFESDRDGMFDTYIMNRDGSNQRRLRRASAPEPSPDGTRIAFHDLADAGSFAIFVMDANGSGTRQLTRHRANDRLPTWSRDGSELLFISDRAGPDEVYAMRADGGHVRRVIAAGPIPVE